MRRLRCWLWCWCCCSSRSRMDACNCKGREPDATREEKVIRLASLSTEPNQDSTQGDIWGLMLMRS
jgi:hypothetical protein